MKYDISTEDVGKVSRSESNVYLCHCRVWNIEAKHHGLVIIMEMSYISRSSRPEVLCKKGVFRNIAKKKESTCSRVSFFNKVAS